jgi:hypothetical protein
MDGVVKSRVSENELPTTRLLFIDGSSKRGGNYELSRTCD